MDGRSASNKAFARRSTPDVASPADSSARHLQPEHEVHCTLDGGPEAEQEATVVGDEVVEPDPGGKVRGDVAVECRIDDLAAAVIRMPGTIRALVAHKPGISPLGFLVETAHIQRHRRLDVIPGVHPPAVVPGNAAIWKLYRSNGIAGCGEVVLLQGKGQVRLRHGGSPRPVAARTPPGSSPGLDSGRAPAASSSEVYALAPTPGSGDRSGANAHPPVPHQGRT